MFDLLLKRLLLALPQDLQLVHAFVLSLLGFDLGSFPSPFFFYVLASFQALQCGQLWREGVGRKSCVPSPRVTPPATLPLQEVVWRLVSSADGESLSGQLCAGAEEEEAWDLQPRL